MKESKANTLLNQYLREKKLYCFYELKVAKGGSFPFSKIEVHQDEGLPALEESGLTWKLSDEDSRRKPCDGMCIPPLPAFLVVKFGGTFFFIPYGYISQMKEEGRKSLMISEARTLAKHVLHT